MTTQTTDTDAWDARLNRDDLAGDAPADPLSLFGQWFADARSAELIEPTGATLATVGHDAKPSARTVLVKRFDDQGFYFYTNYSSRKGQELSANPHAALLFWWDKLERQVRIEGEVAMLSAGESSRYFASRPRGSQIGAHASPQSEVIASRAVLEQRFAETEAQFGSGEIARPENWGGYRLTPEHIEFWQGRKNRLHDRLLYIRSNKLWRIERLAP